MLTDINISNKTPVTLIFDIGKTNKKVLVFNRQLELLHVEETSFEEIVDDDGFPCDDIERIETWLFETIEKISNHASYLITDINFTTYGATLVYLDENGKRLTPLYNYLKPLDEKYANEIYEKYGGKAEFLRKTASPALGMLNAGLQIVWLKRTKPELFDKVKQILHFPQYLSYLFTRKIRSEATSIGCHTALWDFDNNRYHPWLSDEGVELPVPTNIGETIPVRINDIEVKAGIGIHDSSASLVPYLKGSNEQFILVSTGTWCISMNPFNNEPLSAVELENDCLLYMSFQQKPVKSSRVFLGHIFDLNLKRLTSYFGVEGNHFKTMELNTSLLQKTILSSAKERCFFKEGVPETFIDTNVNPEDFSGFEHGYYQLITDLAHLVYDSIRLIITDNIKRLYITGGFARNKQFTHALATLLSNYEVYISELDNATAMGAALVVNHKMNTNNNLGLTRIKTIINE